MSEIRNIPLGGVSNEPNDYNAEDGGLSVSINAVKHHGSIRPVMPGSPVEDIGELPANTDVVAIHEVGDMKHYILLKEIEKPAGARPSSITITLHYLCMPDKVRIWWDSNYPDKFAGPAEMLIGIGMKDHNSYTESYIPYDTPTDISIKGMAVKVDSGGSLVGYDYYDRPCHLTSEHIHPKTIIYVGMGVPSEEAAKYSPTIKNEFVNPKITIACLNCPSKVLLGVTFSGNPGQPISRLRVMMCGGEYDLYPGRWVEVPAEDVMTDITGGVAYSYPDNVVDQELIDPKRLYSPGPLYGDFISGSTVNTDYYTMEYDISTLGSQDAEPGAPGSEGEPETPVEGRYCLSYIDAKSEDKPPIVIASYADEITGVSAIGNVLTISIKGSPLNYIIWKDGEYRILGSEVDAPRIYPYLLTRPMGISEFYSQFGYDFSANAADTNLNEDNNLTIQDWKTLSEGNTEYLTFNATQRKFVYDRTFAIVNSAHRTLSSKGYFYAPFHVRFALRMYDGTHIMHTPCYLMIPCAEGKPILGVEIDSSGGAHLHPVFAASRLFADIGAFDSKWDDIITHIDVFVTPPHINYTDDERSINGACVTYIASEEEVEGQTASVSQPGGATKEYDPMYQRSRKQTGNLFFDYKDPSNKASYINMGTLSFRGGDKSIITPDFDRSAAYFYLIDKTRYPNISASYINGTNRPLPQAKDSLVIGETAEDEDGNTENILLSDTGLTNLTNYVYFSVTKADTAIDRSIMLSGYDEVDITLVWCYRSTIVAERSLNYMLDLRRTDGTNYMDVIQDSNVFHLVKSISTKDLRNGQTGDLYIRENILDNLDSRQILSDQGQMRSRVTTDIAPFAYNNRLSATAERWSLPGTTPISDFCVNNDKGDLYIEKAWVKALVNGQVVYRQLDVGTDNGMDTYADNIRYFYYPSHEATQLILQIVRLTGGQAPYVVQTYPLSGHKLLNGAYAFNMFLRLMPNSTKEYSTRREQYADPDLKAAMEGKTEAVYGNMVRVSGVGNPFYFNEVNQVQLPSGKISGLSTTAKALSQGQFGAFPLYCFSDNGIWALEVSDTGTYSAKQPVSRAVCTNPESITQTEGSVLFVTKRGLMALDGSSVTCISEILSGHNYTSALSKLDKVKELAGLKDVPNPDTHIEEWLQDAKLLYDDKRQMIYAFSEENVLGYVYSISDQAWGMMVHDLAHPLPCYTDALAVTREDSDGKRRLVNMSDHTMCGPAPKALLITRPLTMGVPDGYKTLEAVATRGVLDKDDDKDDDKNYAKLVIWASNDLKKWAIVGTSKTSWYRGKSGTPYKYYRIGLLLDWEEEDSVSGISADVTTRMTNRMR